MFVFPNKPQWRPHDWPCAVEQIFSLYYPVSLKANLSTLTPRTVSDLSM